MPVFRTNKGKVVIKRQFSQRGPTGPAGSSDHAGSLVMPFDYNDAIAGSKIIGILPSGKRSFRSIIQVDQAFDGEVLATVGTTTAQGILQASSDNNLHVERSNIVDKDELVSTLVSMYFNVTNPPTKGSGIVIIYYI